MSKIINLTQHVATPEQVEAGVIDLPAEQRAQLSTLLTFDSLPTGSEIELAAEQIALLCQGAAEGHGATKAMIGGAPWLMATLEAALLEKGIAPVYAFSVRESVEAVQEDGSVRKVNVFRHVGFVEA